MKARVDTTFHMNLNNAFSSGLVASLGLVAFGVLSAIKACADLKTGRASVSVRQIATMAGISTATVQSSIKTLQAAKLLRKREARRRFRRGRH